MWKLSLNNETGVHKLPALPNDWNDNTGSEISYFLFKKIIGITHKTTKVSFLKQRKQLSKGNQPSSGWPFKILPTAAKTIVSNYQNEASRYLIRSKNCGDLKGEPKQWMFLNKIRVRVSFPFQNQTQCRMRSLRVRRGRLEVGLCKRERRGKGWTLLPEHFLKLHCARHCDTTLNTGFDQLKPRSQWQETSNEY